MISFACMSCHKKLSVKEALAGKKVKCPGCAQAIRVPETVETPTLAGASPAPGGEPHTMAPAVPRAADSRIDQPTAAGRSQPDAALGDPTAGLTDFLAPPQADDELGRLGDFRILKILGHGGMGVVFQAEDLKLGRQVALKAMLPHLADSKTSQERFLREARAAAGLEHPHIVAIHHVGEDRGAPFIVMPFLKGEALDARLECNQPLPMADVLRIGREIATGLGAAHAAGLIHRDIKPANIWLEAPDGAVKILDFGLARAAAQDSGLTQQGAIIGTPAYMAPEQGSGKAVDARCDLWSLGVVLYRMCTRKLPFQGADTIATLVTVATHHPPPPAQLNREVPAGLSALVMKLLAKDPAQRIASAEAVVAALRDLEQHPQTTAVKPNLPPPIPTPATRVTARPSLPQPITTTIRKAGNVNARQDPGEPAGPVPARKGRKLRRPQQYGKPLLLAGLPLLLALVIAGIVLSWKPPHALVRTDSFDPRVQIVFDETGPTLTGDGQEPIALPEGAHVLRVQWGPKTFGPYQVVVKNGEALLLKVERFPGHIQVKANGQVIGRADIAVAPPLPPSSPNPVTPPSSPNQVTNSLGMEFALVPKGKSWLGGGGGKPGTKEVEILQDFYLGVYEVTQEEWQKVMPSNPSWFSRTGAGKAAVTAIPDADLKRFPVENISLEDAQLFVTRLNARDPQAGWVYRLPTAGEWEYACRGGPLADPAACACDFCIARPMDQLLPDQANFGKVKGRTCKVGSYAPNRLGLYDLHGNVSEWCEDALPGKGLAPRRVDRGGSWLHLADVCRAAGLRGYQPSGAANTRGLRVARVPVGKTAVTVAPEPTPAPPVRPAGPVATAKVLDELMRRYMGRFGCSAAALAIERNGAPIHVQAYGARDKEGRVPTTPETLFVVGYGINPLVEASVRQLAANKRLGPDQTVFSLSDPLLKRLRIVPVGKLRDPRFATITVEHVLEQKTGWDDDMVQWAEKVALARGIKSPPPEVVLAMMATLSLKEAPGTKVLRCDYNSHILRLVIKTISGRAAGGYFRLDLLGRQLTGIAGSNNKKAREQAVWNAQGEALKVGNLLADFCVSAPALLEVMRRFSANGMPGSRPGLVSSFNGVHTCVMIWHPDGTHVVALFNGCRDPANHDAIVAELQRVTNTRKAGAP